MGEPNPGLLGKVFKQRRFRSRNHQRGNSSSVSRNRTAGIEEVGAVLLAFGPPAELLYMSQPIRHPRRIKLIKPSLQLRLVAIFFGISCLGGLIQALHLGMRLSMLANTLPEGGTYLMAQLPGLPLEIFLVSFFLLLPLTMAVGVLSTFRIAGPVYRFEKFLREVAEGSESQPCRLRNGDQLLELCELLNQATAEAREGNATNMAVDSGDQKEIVQPAA